MASVHWSGVSRGHLREIVAYISRDSAAYAAAVGERIVAAAEQLRQYPRLGRVVPELGDETLRELIVGNYRVVYQVHRRQVEVAAIIHGSQDLRRILARGPRDAG